VSPGRPIVYLTSGIFGYLYRWFPIGRRLRDEGRRSVVVTASAEAAEHARAEGLEVVHLDGQAAALARVPPPGSWPAPLRPFTRRVPGLSLGPPGPARAHWRARAALMADTSELDEVLGRLDPALVLTEAEEHRDIRAVLAAGRRLVLFEDLYAVRPDRDVPFPARSHRLPTGTAASRARAALRWQRFFAVEALRRGAERRWLAGADWHSALARLAPAAGLDRPGATSRRYLQFYDYPGLARLRTVAPELAFPGEAQPPIVIGPIVDPDRRTHGVDPAFDARWAAVRAARAGGERVVYVSLGTFLAGMEDLTRLVVEVLAGVDGQAVVSVGRDAERWAGTPTPGNVAVFGRVPQLEVLAAADLVVTTGGLNTVHEALWFGVPVLALPVAGVDTPGNAARVHLHRVGRRVPPRQLSAERLSDEIRTLLDDREYAERAAAMGDAMRAWDGVRRAVDAIVDAADGAG